MSETPYDQQLRPVGRFQRFPAPPVPLDRALTVVRTLEPLPFVTPPSYHTLSPAPPLYMCPLPDVHLPALAPAPAPTTAPTVPSRAESEIASLPANDELESEPEPEPYSVSVTYEWTEPGPPHGACGRVPTEKKGSATKPCDVVLTDINRTRFIRTVLGAHGLVARYRIMNDNGPPVKIWWKGSQSVFLHIGGKAKPALTTPVSVLFCADDLAPFLICTRGMPDAGFDEEGCAGPSVKVPQVDDAPDLALHADLILKLKKCWPCSTDRGEHGEDGFCFVTPMLSCPPQHPPPQAMGRCHPTFVIPPNIPEFTSVQETAGASTSHSRRSATAASIPTPEVSALVSLIVGPITASIASVMVAVGTRPGMLLDTVAPTPLGTCAVCTPPPILSLTPSALITASITAFREHSGIDLSEGQAYLEHHELTPEVVPEVPYQDLADHLKIMEGKVLKYQLFCREFLKKLKF
ncbi:hypothetical protein FRC10_009076 [Ceratobasidium sp. 414]|nr:hypothetical protein FRC10_009076 [Ceratobasidium sp. 414]